MEKNEVLRITLECLKENPRTQESYIVSHFDKLLREQGKVGTVTKGNMWFSTISDLAFPDDVRLMINEVIWDLVIERIITPGMNALNIEWPWLRVTDMDKLEAKLQGLQ